MGLFSPIYLRVKSDSKMNKKKKAFTALSRVSSPEKLYRAALKSEPPRPSVVTLPSYSLAMKPGATNTSTSGSRATAANSLHTNV